MARRRLEPLVLSEEERSELKGLAGRHKTAQAIALRARIVLACAEGGHNKDVAARLHVDEATVGKWRRRFVERRTAYTTSRVPAHPARLMMPASRP